MKNVMSYQELCEKYFYLVDHYTQKQNLSEDSAAELAVVLCESVKDYVEQQFATPMSTYLHRRLTSYLEAQANQQQVRNSGIVKEDTYFLEESTQYKNLIVGNFWAEIEEQVTPREFYVLRMRFINEMSFREASTHLGVSSVRTQQIERKALRKLRIAYKYRKENFPY